MNYYSVRLEHTLTDIETDLLTDDLAGLGFESFESDGAESARATQTLTAYIPAPAYDVARADIDTLLQD
ncbi:MAG: hypothetical protein K2I83_02530, partial [Bacteroidales bacterium]|nr:hypothetical protein [Bacteroidales bacterium]